jgi:hypothetical protein
MILRKNELFSATRRGAKYSAIHMSLIASAKLNGLNPQRYLEYMLDFLSTKGLTDDNIRAVLPYSKTLPAELKVANIRTSGNTK